MRVGFVLLGFLATRLVESRKFSVDWENNRFVKDGDTYQYVSAGMHYFRIPHQYWKQRIYAAKSAGLNAIQTYVAWNAHEPEPGVFNFEGDLDIVSFIKTVQDHDMSLILRVGPYICAEWNFGGLPPWLLGVPGIQIRTQDPAFMKAVKNWLDVFLPMIEPYLYENGGPIIMVQVENEYGSFGCDHEYINTLYKMFHEILGNRVVYFTTDGMRDFELECGITPPHLFGTVDFSPDDNLEEILRRFRKYQGRGPIVNSELYAGWCDWCGQQHQVTDASKLGAMLDAILSRAMSVNFYMWHGGSTFGLNTGASLSDNPDDGIVFSPQSYDYNAPASEQGDVRLDKYWAIRNATEKHFPGNKMPVPPNSAKFSGVNLTPTLSGYLFQQISPDALILQSQFPHTMEDIGVFEGMIAYQHVTKTPLHNVELSVLGVHDRAYIVVDGVFVQVVKREGDSASVNISINKSIIVFVENMGYINFGRNMKDYATQYKGIRNVTINGTVILTGWSHYKIDITRSPRQQHGKQALVVDIASGVRAVNGKELLPYGPAFFTDTFNLNSTQLLDSFLYITDRWSKGYLIVNDIVIGRYWPDAGPQFTHYIPGVWLKEGKNTVTLLELQSHQESDSSIYFTDTPYIDGPYNPNA